MDVRLFREWLFYRSDYLSIALITLLLPLIWFKTGYYVAWADNFPYGMIEPKYWIQSLTQIWHNIFSGGGEVSYFIAFLPIPLFARFLQFFGVEGPAIQHVILSTFYLLQGISIIFFLRIFIPNNRLATFLGGYFYIINPFIFTYAVSSFIVCTILWAIPLLMGLIIRSMQTTNPYPLLVLSALLLTSVSYVFINPPSYLVLLVSALVAFLIAWLLSKKTVRPIIKSSIFFFTAILLLNLWWIFPAYLTLSQSAVTTTTSAQQWAWSVERNSFLNIISFNTYFAWDKPDFFPYRTYYEMFPILRIGLFIPVLLAIISLLYLRKLVATTVVAFTLLTIFVIKGVHQPFSNISVLSYQIPGMFLFRDPANKLFPFVMLVVATSISFLVSVKSWRAMLSRPSVFFFMMLFLCYSASNFPLFSGAIFVSGGRETLPPTHIQIPAYWKDISDYTGSTVLDGKVLILPEDIGYQSNFSWGYFGGDKLTEEFLQEPYIRIRQMNSTYLNFSNAYIQKTGSIVNTIKDRDRVRFLSLLKMMGVCHILQRNDILNTGIWSSISSPKEIRDFLNSISGITLERSFGALDIYKVEPCVKALTFQTDVEQYLGSEENDYKIFSSGAYVFDDPHGLSRSITISAASEISLVENSLSQEVIIPETGLYALRWGNDSQTTGWYALKASSLIKGRIVFSPEIRSVTVDGRTFDFTQNIKGEILSSDYVDGEPIAIEANSRVAFLGNEIPVLIDKDGKGVSILYDQKKLSPSKTDLFAPDVIGVISNSNLEPAALGVTWGKEFDPDTSSDYFVLRTAETPAYASKTIFEPNPKTTYLLNMTIKEKVQPEFQPKIISADTGEFAQRVAWDMREEAGGWFRYRYIFQFSENQQRFRYFVYAPGANKGNSLTIKDIYCGPLAAISSRVFLDPSPIEKEQVLSLTSGSHTVSRYSEYFKKHESLIQNPTFSDGLFGWSLIDANNYDHQQFVGTEILALPKTENSEISTFVKLSASKHTAGLSQTALLEKKVPLSYYLSLYYRNIQGSGPSSKIVYKSGDVSKYLEVPLKDSKNWTRFENMYSPYVGYEKISLYLYSQSLGSLQGENDYSRIVLKPFFNFGDIIFHKEREPVDHRSTSTDYEFSDISKVSSALYTATLSVRGVSGGLISFLENYSDDWNLYIRKKGSHLSYHRIGSDSHVIVNGYANGWWITEEELRVVDENSNGDEFEIRIEYSPQRLIPYFASFSGLTALLLIIYVVWGCNRKRVLSHLNRTSL